MDDLAAELLHDELNLDAADEAAKDARMHEVVAAAWDERSSHPLPDEVLETATDVLACGEWISDEDGDWPDDETEQALRGLLDRESMRLTRSLLAWVPASVAAPRRLRPAGRAPRRQRVSRPAAASARGDPSEPSGSTSRRAARLLGWLAALIHVLRYPRAAPWDRIERRARDLRELAS